MNIFNPSCTVIVCPVSQSENREFTQSHTHNIISTTVSLGGLESHIIDHVHQQRVA